MSSISFLSDHFPSPLQLFLYDKLMLLTDARQVLICALLLMLNLFFLLLVDLLDDFFSFEPPLHVLCKFLLHFLLFRLLMFFLLLSQFLSEFSCLLNFLRILHHRHDLSLLSPIIEHIKVQCLRCLRLLIESAELASLVLLLPSVVLIFLFT